MCGENSQSILIFQSEERERGEREKDSEKGEIAGSEIIISRYCTRSITTKLDKFLYTKHLDSSVSQLRITKSTFDKVTFLQCLDIALILTIDTPSHIEVELHQGGKPIIILTINR